MEVTIYGSKPECIFTLDKVTAVLFKSPCIFISLLAYQWTSSSSSASVICLVVSFYYVHGTRTTSVLPIRSFQS